MPMPINNLSPTGAALGLGRIPGLGGALGNQVGDETEEERRRRMALLAQQRQLGLAAVRLRRHCLVARCWAALVFKSTEQTHDEPYPASATKCAV